MPRRSLTVPSRRGYSSHNAPPPLDEHPLDQWIASEKELSLTDTFRPEHLADLYITLPTRDGSRRGTAFAPPAHGDRLAPGHHLVFFHSRMPENALRADGTTPDFCPPEPFTRRMWAGGRMAWKRPLCVGDVAEAVATVASVKKRGFDKGAPMVFVTQKIEYWTRGELCVEEERDHVYFPSAVRGERIPKEGALARSRCKEPLHLVMHSDWSALPVENV